MTRDTVLITGGAGFIGTNLALDAIKKGYKVILLDNLSRNGTYINLDLLSQNEPLEFVHCDIRDFNRLSSVVAKYAKSLKSIFHLAAQVAVTTSVVDPRNDFEVNALGSFNLLEAVREYCPEVPVIYSSTNKVYGGLETIDIMENETRYSFKNMIGVSETQPLDYHSPYGCSKGIADQYMIDYYRIYGLKTVIMRQSCIYGPHQMGLEDQGWIAWFLIATMLNKPITLYGTGKQVRDVLFVEDLINVYWKALENIDTASGKAYNIGGGEFQLSLIEFVVMLEDLFGKKIPYTRFDYRPGDQPVFVCDLSLVKKELGWQPKVSPEVGIKKLYDWILENKETLRRVL